MSTTSLVLKSKAAKSIADMQLDQNSTGTTNPIELGYVPMKLIALPSTLKRSAAASEESVTVAVPKAVREYPLPASRETHEMAMASDDMLLITQQTNSTLVKVQLDDSTGRPVACARFSIENFWAGLHGLYTCQTEKYKGQVWASLQFKSVLIRISMGEKVSSTPVVEQEIKIPSPAYGPHCVIEIDGNLWAGCKDSHHVVRINYDDETDYVVYACSAHPIFIAKHTNTNDIYASLDSSSKIWHLDNSTGKTEEIDIPSTKGTTPVGLIAGPDGNVWFVLVGGTAGGTGTFGRILKGSVFEWFSLTTTLGATAGLLHLAFDWDYQQVLKEQTVNSTVADGTTTTNLLHVWLLSSTLVADAGNSIDGIFDVIVDTDVGRITHVQSVVLPTQICWTHRVLPHRTGLFITELQMSTLAHVDGSAVFKPTDVVSETSDFYSDFGLGVPYNYISFSGDTATRAALIAGRPALAAASTTATLALKASSAPKSKRART